MSPLDMCFFAAVIFAAYKTVQLWIVWEINRDCYRKEK